MKGHVIARRALALLAVPAMCFSAPVAAHASAGTGTASGYGWIRLAHFSPNTPAVDVYLYSFGGTSALVVLKHVAYGEVSPYERVVAGEYSVAMRSAGAAATTPPVLSTSVRIGSGRAYTVAGLGPESGLRLAVLDDRLTTPPGHALVRVIQASLRQHLVKVTYDSSTLASNLAFASVSSYRAVASGTGSVSVTAASGDANRSVSLGAETVHTLVVLDGTSGLEIADLEDAAGNTAMPAGGVATGLGGTAPPPPSSPVPWVALIAMGTALAVAAAGRLLLLFPALGRRRHGPEVPGGKPAGAIVFAACLLGAGLVAAGVGVAGLRTARHQTPVAHSAPRTAPLPAPTGRIAARPSTPTPGPGCSTG